MIKIYLNNNTKKQIDIKFIEEVIQKDGILYLSKKHQDYEEIRNKYPNLYIMSDFDDNFENISHCSVYIYEMLDFLENIFGSELKGIRTENSKKFKIVITI